LPNSLARAALPAAALCSALNASVVSSATLLFTFVTMTLGKQLGSSPPGAHR
jgi:hypothetical protein